MQLTPMQRRIVQALTDCAPNEQFAAFTGDKARKIGFEVMPAKAGGIIIRAYASPEYFLVNRGLLERVDRGTPGTWYRLTEKGKAHAPKPRSA